MTRMYTYIYKQNKKWHVSNINSMNNNIIEEAALKALDTGTINDYRIIGFKNDNQWMEICDLVADANKGDHEAAYTLGIVI